MNPLIDALLWLLTDPLDFVIGMAFLAIQWVVLLVVAVVFCGALILLHEGWRRLTTPGTK
jgi:UPF0716 family protein affecting phage T7 exclusion